MSSHFDIVIVGGGAAGLSAAALLADQGRRLAVIEPRPAAPPPDQDVDPRVVAISPGSARILDHAGVWSALDPARRQAYARMQVLAEAGRIEFRAAEHGLEQLGWIMEVPTLAWALWRQLEESGRVQLLGGRRLARHSRDARRVSLELDDGQRLSCPLLVAADGGRSPVRQAAGIGVDTWDYNQRALIGHVRTERPNDGLAWQRFTEFGPLALLPLPDGRSSIVWSQPEARAQALSELDDEAFLAELNHHQDSPFGAAVGVGPRLSLALVRRVARTLTAQRLVLLGDAARSVHPLAGQGLNLGLADAAALAEVLADWDSREAPELALTRYQRWRASNGALLGGGIHAINELAHAPGPARQLMGAGFALATRLWPLKDRFVRHACGLDSDSPALSRAPGSER